VPPDVRLECEGSVAFLTLDSPSTANALTPSIAQELIEACAEIDANAALGAAVVRSSGHVFCAGAHRDLLREMQADPLAEQSFEADTRIYESFNRLAQLKVPSIAAVRGAAVGGGVNLMLATDLRIVAFDARIDSGFLRLGFHPGGGHYAFLARRLSREAVTAIGLFGEAITGARAAELGLAWQAVSADEVEPRARELAVRVARSPAVARMAIASLRHELGPPAMSLASAIELERAAQLYSVRMNNAVPPAG
jgi:enoyl-CoA hydratase